MYVIECEVESDIGCIQIPCMYMPVVLSCIQVQWLLNFCPNLKDNDTIVLSDDNLSGVVALGLFAVKSQLKV